MVKFRDDQRGVVVICGKDRIQIMQEHAYDRFNYDNDLKHLQSKDYDIMQVKRDGVVILERKDPFVPKHGDEYFFIGECGTPFQSTWMEGSCCDKLRFGSGNCYKLRADAIANKDKHKGAIERAYQARLEELKNE